MNSKEIISSGLLELYALGQCNAAEKELVEKMAVQHADVREELDAAIHALESYLLSNEQTPPAGLKEKIAAALKDEMSEVKKEAKVINLNAGKENSSADSNRIFKFLAAASIVLLIMSSIMNYHFNSRLQETQDKLAQLKTEKDVLSGEIEVQKNNNWLMEKKMEVWEKDMAVLKKPGLVPMEMKGMPVAPEAKAMVYLDTKTNDVYLEINNLPKAPEGMQYQLWAIMKGKPVNAGMIELCEQPDTCGIHKMTTMDAHAFAISLEKKGGSETPQGSIYAGFGI